MKQPLVTQQSSMPTRKVSAAVLGAMAASVLADLVVGNIPGFDVVAADQLETVFIGLGGLAAGWWVRDRYVPAA